jgi:predicted dehydrogenase/threonine dehydrogenase-like Zn-dependent dehydrogenase
MEQIILDKNTGNVYIEEIPPPVLGGKGAIVKTGYSLISSGTEISMILRSREGRFAQSRRMIPEDGIISYIKRKIKSGTLVKSTKSVVSSLTKSGNDTFGNLISLGYSNAGIVVEKDPGIDKVNINDKVACAGARHAGFNYVPVNLFTKVPEEVDLREAAFTTIGCIAMQGVRRAQIRLGERVVIIGQGIIGQIAAQLVRLSGGYSIVSDLSQWRLDMAKKLGADKIVNATKNDFVKEILEFTKGIGADKVIICASSASSKPLRDAINMARDKGRIVLVGDVKIEIPREPFYEKELDFVISRSYGPGRYDPIYEQKGYDYPFDRVRWTENRNMEEFLRLLSEKKINVKDLITHEYDILDAPKAYNNIINNPDNTLGVILKYNHNNENSDYGRKIMFCAKQEKIDEKRIKTAIIGCGNFASKYHLPNIKKISDYQLVSIVNATGLKAKEIATKHKINSYTTDYKEFLSDSNVDLVIITTRHNLHATIAMEALKSNKHVFLEKPMAINLEDAYRLADEVKRGDRKFTIGFNRRFSPLSLKVKERLKNTNKPIIINYRVANTFAPSNAWPHDLEEGGGTIIGECCHFFDLIYWFIGKEPVKLFAEGGNLTHPEEEIFDNAVITIRFSDGSVGNITFTDMGKENFPKEKIEVFTGEQVMVIDDFQKLNIYGVKKEEVTLKSPDKGHFNQFVNFAQSIKQNLEPDVTYKDGLRALLCCVKTIESLKNNSVISLGVSDI